MNQPIIAVVAGTRPEVIKLSPVVEQLRNIPGQHTVRVYSTGQHRSLLTQTISSLHLTVDEDFDLMTHDQSPAEIQRRVVSSCDHAWHRHRPDLVVVQGDTVTAFGGAMAAWLNKIPVAHVEAGLRSFDLMNPWPEEGMRQMIARIANLHLAPTQTARENLLKEGIVSENIHVVGNPGIDSFVRTRTETELGPIPSRFDCSRPFALITMHRREAIHRTLGQFCSELKKAISLWPDLQFIWPMHPNPSVRETIREAFGHLGADQIILCDPLPYHQMTHLLPKAQLVISDSGGMQEEAPYHGVPIVVMRDVTERPEILELGLGKLGGANGRELIPAMEAFLGGYTSDSDNVAEWQQIQGNAKSSAKIAECILGFTTA